MKLTLNKQTGPERLSDAGNHFHVMGGLGGIQVLPAEKPTRASRRLKEEARIALGPDFEKMRHPVRRTPGRAP